MKPKFILSKKKVLEQYKAVKKLCDIVAYSSKTNPLITKILEENTNSFFSIHLINELKNVNDKSRVIFLAQAWNEKLIGKVINLGIKWFVVDNENDLDVLLSFLEKNNVFVNLLLRMKLKENTLKTERYFVFGMNSKIINKRLRELSHNEKISCFGIHFHRKTQNMSEWDLVYEITEVIEQDVFEKISFVNVGGGLPSEYANTNAKVVNNILERISEFRNFLKKFNIKLIIEPGRFISAPAVRLVTNIVSVYDNTIVVDASVYNADMDALIVPVKLKVENELSKGKAYVIKGITPCSMDLFRYRVYLKNPKAGDELVFLNAGAYNFHTEFCDLEKIETVVVE